MLVGVNPQSYFLLDFNQLNFSHFITSHDNLPVLPQFDGGDCLCEPSERLVRFDLIVILKLVI